MQYCKIHELVIDPLHETCPLCAAERDTDTEILRTFYNAVRDVAKTTDGLGIFEEAVMVALGAAVGAA